MKADRPIAFTDMETYKPAAKIYELRDAVVPGLRFVVHPSGARSWVLRYSFNGRYCKLTVGRYPQIPLTESAADKKARLARDPKSHAPDARGIARAALGKIASGVNPAAERKENLRLNATGQADEDLIKSVWAAYVEKHLTGNPEVRESTKTRYTGLFEKHILPKWEKKRLGELDEGDVQDAIDAAKKRGPAAANSTYTVLSAFFGWVLSRKEYRKYLAASPMKDVEKPFADTESERTLSDEEIKTFWEGCDALGNSFVFGPMFKLLLLTGARRNEIADMTWDELDLKNRYIRLPGSRSKNGKPHDIYLSDAALAIIKAIKAVEKCKFVFTTDGEHSVSGFSKAKKRLDEKTSDMKPWRLHDLRRTFASGVVGLGFSETVADKCLNHSPTALKGIGKIYIRHNYAPQMQAAWTAWGGAVARIVHPDAAANVIELRPENAPALAG